MGKRVETEWISCHFQGRLQKSEWQLVSSTAPKPMFTLLVEPLQKDDLNLQGGKKIGLNLKILCRMTIYETK